MSVGNKCGKSGEIKCIFYSEFHHTEGPKIKYQAPEGFISKELFDLVSSYVIPKREILRRVVTVNVLNYKILGYPVSLDQCKYARNALIWNLCFVFDGGTKTTQYEPVVTKLAEFLVRLEIETGFLEKEDQLPELQNIMQKVLDDLNLHHLCTLNMNNSNRLHIRIGSGHPDPPAIQDHEVPIFIPRTNPPCLDKWDLTSNQLSPYIDGFTHMAKLAIVAEMDKRIAKACVQNLIYFEVVGIVSIFQYSNLYAVTAKSRQLYEDKDLQSRCVHYVCLDGSPAPSLRNIMNLYSAFQPGVTVRDLCVRFLPHTLNIDEKKLTVFGELHGILRRIRQFPMFIGKEPAQNMLDQLCDGKTDTDAICCKTQIPYDRLMEHIENDPNLVCL